MIRGWKARDPLDRLHQFVRALDALMKLEMGSGEAQFAERLSVLASARRLHEVALEIYRLRNYEEHLSEWPSKLGYIKETDRRKFVSHRSFQAEVLAGAAYSELLSNSSLRTEFRDSNVETFWAANARSWISKLDLDARDSAFYYSSE